MLYTMRGKIANVTPLTLDKTLTLEGACADAKAVGDAIAEAKRIAKEQDDAHGNLKNNPHNVTVEQLGLDKVDNTSDMDKPVSTAQATAIADAKKAGTEAKASADKAQTSANNAQTSANNAQTSADNAQTSADNAQTTANNAVAAIEASKFETTGTIGTSWNGSAAPYTQAVAIDGILATDKPHIFPVYSDTLETALAQQEAWAMVSRAVTSANTITFYCFEDKPETEIPIQIEVNR